MACHKLEYHPASPLKLAYSKQRETKQNTAFYFFDISKKGRRTLKNGFNHYTFGFQGQEAENELTGQTGSHSFFKYRISDNRIGRFFAIDPLTRKYPYLTPYQFSSNQPIHARELEGLETSYELGMHNANIEGSWGGDVSAPDRLSGTTRAVGTSLFNSTVDGATYFGTSISAHLGITEKAYGYDGNGSFHTEMPYCFDDGWSSQLRFWGGGLMVVSSTVNATKGLFSLKNLTKVTTSSESNFAFDAIEGAEEVLYTKEFFATASSKGDYLLFSAGAKNPYRSPQILPTKGFTETSLLSGTRNFSRGPLEMPLANSFNSSNITGLGFNVGGMSRFGAISSSAIFGGLTLFDNYQNTINGSGTSSSAEASPDLYKTYPLGLDKESKNQY